MKNNIIFWSLFGVMSVLAYSGAVFFDQLQMETQNKKLPSAAVEENEPSCVNRLFNEIKPLLDKTKCDSFSFNVPRHWYLSSQNVCDGRILPFLVNPKGFNDFQLRKNMWKIFLHQLTYTTIGIEETRVGGDDWLLRFQAGLEIASVGGDMFEIGGNALKVMKDKQAGKVLFLIDRNQLGQFLRSAQGMNKYTTYKNAIGRAANTLLGIADRAEAAGEFGDAIKISKEAEERIKFEMAIEDANEFLHESYLQELMNNITSYISEENRNSYNWFDPALIEANKELSNLTEEHLESRLTNYIENKRNRNIIEIDKSLISLISPVIVGGETAPGFGVLLVAAEYLPTVFFYWDKHPYIYPLYLSTLAYTFAESELGNDNFSLYLKSSSILLGDVLMHKFFEGDIVTAAKNLTAFDPQTGEQWRRIIVDNRNRNDELNYLVKGYLAGGTPCLANVKGRVISVEGNPIDKASVSMINEKDIVIISTTPPIKQTNPFASKFTQTDGNGYFHFTIKEDGNYILRASKEGFCTEEIRVTLKNSLLLFNNQQLDIINITLQTPHTTSSGTLRSRYSASSSWNHIIVNVELYNEDCTDIVHILPYGTTFKNNNTYHQNISLAKEVKLLAYANSTTRYTLDGYCISRYKMGVAGELVLDPNLFKKEYEIITKQADAKGWHETNRSDVQSALWYFSDNVGVSKGSKAEELVNIASTYHHQPFANKIDTSTSLGSVLCTLIISLPLFSFTKKFLI